MDLILLTDELFKKLEHKCLSILIFEAFLFRFLQ